MRLRTVLIILLLLAAAGFVVQSIRPFSSKSTQTPPNSSSPRFGGMRFPPSHLRFEAQNLGAEPASTSKITNVQIVDLDGDGNQDVIACDARLNRVLWLRQAPLGTWDEKVLGEDLVAPAHASVVDLDRDGDLDVIVSVLGNIYPDNGVIGSIVLLDNEGDGRFTRTLILDDVRRVADVQPGDFDSDGDLDLAVAVFGYAHGQILWLENRGKGRFYEHPLMSAPGPIHVPVADFDGDGDVDIAAGVSQYEEEVWGFENLGDGQFRPRRLFFSINYDLGSAGLVLNDLDRDGDPDLLLPVGDNLEHIDANFPQPYHGCLWLENRGGWDFVTRRIGTFCGTYAAAPGDLDGDGDNDVVLVSMDNEWDVAGNPSLVWLENDGEQNFQTREIADRPIRLITVAIGDLDGDNRLDIVTGGFRWTPPFERLGRVTAFLQRGRTDVSEFAQSPAITLESPPLPKSGRIDAMTAADLHTLREALRAKVTASKANASDWQKLADAYQAYGLFRQAHFCYETALNYDNAVPSFDLLYNSALCFSQLGLLAEAASQFRRAAELASPDDSAKCWYNVGRNYLRADNAGFAEEAFAKAPDSHYARYQLAKLLTRSGRAAQAVSLLDGILAKNSETVQPLWLRARIAETFGKGDDAVNFFDRFERASRFSGMEVDLGHFGELRGSYGMTKTMVASRKLVADNNFEEAAKLLDDTLGRIQSDFHYLFVLVRATMALRLGDTDGAIQRIQRRLDEDGPNVQAFDLLGQAYALQNRPEEAAAAWESAVTLQPTSVRHLRLSQLYEGLKLTELSQRQRRRARYRSGLEAFRTGVNFERAIQDLEAAASMGENSATLWFYIGEAWRVLGSKKARGAYEKCLSVDPEYARARRALERVQ